MGESGRTGMNGGRDENQHVFGRAPRDLEGHACLGVRIFEPGTTQGCRRARTSGSTEKEEGGWEEECSYSGDHGQPSNNAYAPRMMEKSRQAICTSEEDVAGGV
ncbi:hypothetical protein GCG54_00003801 [Colletotrichum gloeosporioides]|uniref:Uncharacterized protein n=1 Tax=Colletotrichum gloeosporioides TaxID=474922 RepID=A0A8H4FHS9_COLGL|nr:uncharacterized protein GCG54_00003801 [Colletotrichum gloeosporioides]KAF3802341.1 hypothetical protein GCG54_00003801 [Colletotrichum gloeosporioides]